MQKRVSEQQFELFCAQNGIPCRRIEADSTLGRQSPDFEIQTATGRTLVEVKQFDPNEEDSEIAEQVLEHAHTLKAIGGEPGARARLKIQSGAKQLKARSRGRIPTILVLYNNVPFNNRGVDAYEIKTAMYGLEKIDLTVSSSQVTVIDRGFGPKRKVTPSSNTSLSAVATLHDPPDSELLLMVYHNVHAAVPLDWKVLARPTISHYTIAAKRDGSFQEWCRLDK